MDVKAGYRQTEVGVIPEDWNIHTLKELSDKIMVGIASAATHAYRNKGVVLLRNQNIKSGYLDDGDVLYLDPKYELVFKNKRLKTGDLLTARTGYPGTTCVVPSKYKSAQSFTTLITRPNQMRIDSTYLCYYINSEKGQCFFEQNKIGGGQKNVNAGALQTMPIPLPSLPEQRAIATALSDMDALITSLDKLIAKKRDIKQAAMQELLSGKRRLPGFSEVWKNTTIGEVTEKFLNGGTPSTVCPEYWDGDIQWTTSAPMTSYYLDYGENTISLLGLEKSASNLIQKNNVIIASRVGIGKVVINRIDIAINQDLTGIILKKDKISPEFFVWLLHSHKYNQKLISISGGTTIKGLKREDLEKIIIPLPSVFEQQSISLILLEMDADLTALEQKRDKTKAIKQGMMQELLTGRIRLV